MKFPTVVFSTLCTLLVVNASSLYGNTGLSARHAQLAHRRGSQPKRCPARIKKVSNNVLASTSTKVEPSTSIKAKVAPTPPPAPKPTEKAATSDHSSSPSGLIDVSGGSCGANGATNHVTATSGPNGDIDWLTCGINSPGGWSPPYVKVENIITQSLSDAIQAPNSPFKACSEFVWIFEKYAAENGIPAILLASFAMQESSCKPNTVGGAGEQGLMQITKDKCGGAPNGNCMDPEFNIATAASYFANSLKNNGGNLIKTVGGYNGWTNGLTVGEATAPANGPCCRCQQNLDYLHQFFNGWCQNVNPYNGNPRLGKYFNLDVCNK